MTASLVCSDCQEKVIETMVGKPASKAFYCPFCDDFVRPKKSLTSNETEPIKE